MSHQWMKLNLDDGYNRPWKCSKCKSTHRDLAVYMSILSLEGPQDDALVSINDEMIGTCEEAQVAEVHET